MQADRVIDSDLLSFALKRQALLYPVVLALASLGVYLPSLQNYVGEWDAAELQTVAQIGGIAHPPGLAAYTVVAWVFVHALVTYDVTGRLPVLSALFIAGAALTAYFTGRILGASYLAAFSAALVFALGSSTWELATRPDVHPMAIFLGTLALLLLLRWKQTLEAKYVVIGSLCFGLGLATHGIVIWSVVSGAVMLADSYKRLRLGTALQATLAFFLGLLPILYLPIRSAAIDRSRIEPTLALGLPAGQAFYNYDDPATLPGFFHLVAASDFPTKAGFMSVVDIFNFIPHLAVLAQNVLHDYHWFFLTLGALGIFLIARRNLCSGMALSIFGIGPAFFVQGFSEASPERYFIPAYWSLTVAAAVMITVPSRAQHRRRVGRYLLSGLCMVLAASLFVRYIDRIHQHNYISLRYERAVRQTTSRDAVIVVPWLHGTTLAFFAYAAHSLGDRIVVIGYGSKYKQYFARWLPMRAVYLLDQEADVDPGYYTESRIVDGISFKRVFKR